mmetsp:Transcript_586/g.744  ORF Transcript_586/g.744 Transcript_586/m.744 type:complete len:476 (-) Transcript_586:1181-2608(-)|eukprot:CAMPEP_0204823992 /NCGR_PEP_ID=MMETSP1346-20131115/2057_1 /ASSEMBLY_ACC=CAM_ASM_000771 /TAXON_ID=215587 /ORGANISM="Aplanochytrium stocchinoi, Strain GSBS06" /LENGTH=475 /DNA_ID=CAMNT_0051950917 /DNA_START=87 /DNA_END=1517 /DNA_ORIENTATION=-
MEDWRERAYQILAKAYAEKDFPEKNFEIEVQRPKMEKNSKTRRLIVLPVSIILILVCLCSALYTFTEIQFLPGSADDDSVDKSLFTQTATLFRWVGGEDDDEDEEEDDEDLLPMHASGNENGDAEFDIYKYTVGDGSGRSIPVIRTSNIPYDDIKTDGSEKYFMYSPSGGFNNQRKEMESAIQIAKTINRTLLVPMAAKHTTWWSKYHYLKYDSLVPMDLLLDFNEMSKYGPKLVAMNTTVFDMERKLLNQKGMLYVKHPKHRVNWKGDEVKENLGDPSITETVLFMKGPSMYHAWFRKPIMFKVREHVVYSPYVRRLAIEYMKRLGTHYNAVHIRLGDYFRHGRFPNPRSFVNGLLTEGFSTDHVLYIATEPKRPKGFFDHFEKTFKVKYASDFGDIVDSFRDNFKPNTINDVLGLIEQMICVGARKFRGTSYSNFSANINYMRTNRESHFPEVPEVRRQIEAKMESDAVKEST